MRAARAGKSKSDRLGKGARLERVSSRGGLSVGRFDSTLRFAALSLALALPALILFGCGLDTVAYYSPPDFAYAGNLITLRHNTDNNDSSFLGYDIYYRAYYSLTEANTARSSIESATNSTSSTPESVLSLLSSNSFKKIHLATAPTTDSTPLLPEGPDVFYFYLPSTLSTNWYYITNKSATAIAIVRNDGYGDSFNDSYKVGDSDYGSSSSGVGSRQTVYIDAFAVAYGYDFSSLKSIYSFPASLYEPIGGSNGYTLP